MPSFRGTILAMHLIGEMNLLIYGNVYNLIVKLFLENH
jgi:hypothetical protein